MSGSAVLMDVTLQQGENRISTVVYKKDLIEVRAWCDMGLLEESSSKDYHLLVFLNIFGSSSEVRAIHSGVASWSGVELNGIKVFRNYSMGMLRAKMWNVGYGKYQMFIWHEEAPKTCIIKLPCEDELYAWERFLNRRKIPFVKEWIPSLKEVLTEEGYIKRLYGTGGVEGWLWMTSDDEVCNLIVDRIWR